MIMWVVESRPNGKENEKEAFKKRGKRIKQIVIQICEVVVL